MLIGHFVACKRRLKVNADKNKVIALGGEEGLVFKIILNMKKL